MAEEKKYFDLNGDFYRAKFDNAQDYETYLATGDQRYRERWQGIYDKVKLQKPQQELLASFKRKMLVLCLSGIWCGDCVTQGPVLRRIQEATSVIDLRFLDRDANPDIRDMLRINGAMKVPVVLFLSEDYFECARFGDRTLSTYRRIAKTTLGPSCATGIVPPADEELNVLVSEWVDEFERIQLILRLSPMLRQRYGE